MKKQQKNNRRDVLEDDESDEIIIESNHNRNTRNNNINNNQIETIDEDNMSDDELEDLRLKDLEVEDKIRLILNQVRSLDIKKEIGEKEKLKESRLVIDKIELENFKSYQGLKVMGPLYYKFNAVVGPNGSGKSNLMESLLFVFGKRAKKMRLKKLSELIHKSAEYPNIKYARVSVYFKSIIDKSDGSFEEIPNSEFVLTREVNKNSSSKYYLNKKDITFEELCPILEANGIDLKHNRFLILQGEVEQISMLAPKSKPNSKDPGLLEYLEDIIGTKRYVKTIDRLATYTEEITEIKANKEKLVRISRNDLDKLEEVKNISINYFKEEKELFYLSYLSCLIKIFNNNKEIETLNQIKEDKNELKKQKDDSLNDLKRDNQDLLNSLKNIKKEQAKLNSEIERVVGEMTKLEVEDRKIRNEIESEEAEYKKMEKTRKNIMTSLNELMEKRSKAKEDYENIEKQLNTKQKAKDKLENEIKKIETEFSDKTREMTLKKQHIVQKINPKLREIENIKLEIMHNEKNYNLLLENVEKINVELEDISKKESNTHDLIQERLVKSEEYKRDYDSFKKLSIESKNEYKQKQQDIMKTEKELHYLQSKISEFKEEKNESQFKNKMIQEIMNAKMSGNLPGIIGRLGDLASIEPQYDIAISTCCPQLDSILVENQDSARQTIAFLKKYNLGRANFILLNQVDHLWNEIKKPFTAPKNSQRVFDLIRISKNEYTPAFYFSLKNTLVVDDIRTANNIAYSQQRHRVVTMQGGIIEVSGAMSGGGQPKRGLINTKENKNKDSMSEQELNEIVKQYDKVRQKLEEMIQHKTFVEKKMEKVDQDFLKVENTLSTLDSEIGFYQKQQLDLAKQKQALINEKKNFSRDTEKLKELEEKDKQLINQKNSLEAIIQPDKDEIINIDKEINKIRGNNFEEKKEKFNELKKEFNELRKKLTEYDNIIETCPKEIERLKSEIDEKEKEKIALDQSIKNKQNLMNSYVDIVCELDSEKQKLNENKIKLTEESDLVIKKHANFKEKLTLITEEKRAIEDEINKIGSQIKEMKKREDSIKGEARDIHKEYNKSISEFGFIDEIEDEIKKINNDRNNKSVKKNDIVIDDSEESQSKSVNNFNINNVDLEKIEEDENEYEATPIKIAKKTKTKESNYNNSFDKFFSEDIFKNNINDEEFTKKNGLLENYVRIIFNNTIYF